MEETLAPLALKFAVRKLLLACKFNSLCHLEKRCLLDVTTSTVIASVIAFMTILPWKNETVRIQPCDFRGVSISIDLLITRFSWDISLFFFQPILYRILRESSTGFWENRLQDCERILHLILREASKGFRENPLQNSERILYKILRKSSTEFWENLNQDSERISHPQSSEKIPPQNFERILHRFMR